MFTFINKNAMKKTLKLLTLLLFVAVSSCSNPSQVHETSSINLLDNNASETSENSSNTNSPSSKWTQNNQEESEAIERLIVKEGNLRFETADAKKTREIINNEVKQFNGYIAQDNSSNYNSRTEYTVTIRIPAKDFESLLNGISETASKIDSKNISAIDVTEEYIDVQARIKTKKEIEERYKELLKKGNSIEDILNIESKLGELRADIESFEGRLKYLQSRISMSTLTVTFYEKGESSSSFGNELSSALSDGWDNMLTFVIGIFHIWPFILLSIAIIVIIRRIRKRKKQNKVS